MNEGSVPATGIDDPPVEVRSFEVLVTEALAIAWERWEKVRGMDNPAGYFYRVGQISTQGHGSLLEAEAVLAQGGDA